MVDYCDPFFARAHKTRKYDLKLESIPVSAEAFAGYDAVVVSTAHDQFKDPALYAGVKLIIDTRNALTRLFPPGEGPRVVTA